MESVKRFLLWVVVSGVAFGISHGQGNYLIFAGWLLLSFIVYIADCLRAPMRRCWRCRGAGTRSGFLFTSDSGACTGCEGRSGRQPRIGTKLFRLPRH